MKREKSINLKIISAGAGSGKTYRLTTEMVDLLKSGVRASGIIATTFTRKAAAELQERVRVRLLQEGLTQQADELTNALIGTVHGLGVKLLRRFAFEAGVSPEVEIIADEDQQLMFNQALSTVLTGERVHTMERLSDRLGLNKRENYDWRREVKNVTDVARANDFSAEKLEDSRRRSFESFRQFLGAPIDQSMGEFNQQLDNLLTDTITRLEQNGDATKKTQVAVQTLKAIQRDLQLRGELFWHQWVKIGKTDVGAKSRDDVADLIAFAFTHDTHPVFHQDIEAFIDNIFGIAQEALQEYDQYKQSRGLIDYTDMEVLISRLLNNEQVKAVLSQELDLLMVDEFQDTSPLQLEIFLKLSRFAKHSVWVGDPKQSIYGFRGAEPRLMHAIIAATGGIKTEDILPHSWRSREDIVFATNALFTKAFPELPPEQIALTPKRCRQAGKDSDNKEDEPATMQAALLHWHFHFDGEGRPPGKPWLENCIASTLEAVLAGKLYVLPKGEKNARPALPGDVAILCRSNAECQQVAEALHRAGLQAAIARSGLLGTAEARLILACLKYVLHQEDSLSVAELLLLGSGISIEEIIEDRLAYLDEVEKYGNAGAWAASRKIIRALNELREQGTELSSAEILDLLLEELDLRRTIVGWGNAQQRLDNVDVLRRFALQYEEACNRLHSAASLGGFLLWLHELERNQADDQGSGEGPHAVNVMTYHRSKGLEWPVVICHSLEGSLRSDVWGIDIISEREEVDLDDVLGGRWLRYWVNPYSDQFRNTPLEERIDASAVKAEKIRQAREEEARLLYVGITRARDYLVFPTGFRPTKWLNRVWHDGNEDFPTLEADTHETPWEWQGKFLDIETETFFYPRDFTHAEMAPAAELYFAARLGKKDHQTYRIDLTRKDHGVETPHCYVRSPQAYASPIDLQEDFDKYNLAKAVKAYFNADQPDYAGADRLWMATELILRFQVEEMIDAPALVKSSGAWQDFISAYFKPKNLLRKYPVYHFHQEHLFETVIDLVIEQEGGMVLIQNSGFSGVGKGCEKKAKELAPWLYLSREALQKIFGTPNVRTYVHFVLSSTLVEVGFSRV